MKHIVKKNWVTGGNKQIDFYDLLRLTRKYVQKGSKIFIGSEGRDSKVPEVGREEEAHREL